MAYAAHVALFCRALGSFATLLGMSQQKVAAVWETMPWLVSEGQQGKLVSFSNPSGFMTRRDVLNNADILGPLIAELGTWA